MPSAATYRVSNREEDKIRGRDQSFRNCVVTMFIFVMLCVIIILASLPWRNANARNNYDYRELDNSHTEPRLNRNETERGKNNGTLQYPESTSTKSQDTTTVPSTTIRKNTQPSSTVSYKNIESIGASIDTLSTTIQNNIGTTQNIRDNVDITTTTIHENIAPLSTTSQDNVEISSTIFIAGSESSESGSSIISPKIETFTESILLSSTDHYMTAPSESHGTSTDSSVEIETSPFSSSMRSESSMTEADGFFYTEETAGSTVEFSTESTIDFPSSSEQLLTSSEVLSTLSARVIEESWQTEVTSEVNNDFTSLRKLIVARYFGNDSSTSKATVDMDWLEDDSITTPNYQKNYTDGRKNELSVATTVPWENRSDSVTTDIYSNSKVQVATTTNIDTDDNYIDTSTQIANNKHENEMTTNVYTDQNQIQSTTNTANHVFDDLLEKNDTSPNEVCVSGRCKQFSSRILSYMNHSADPCEDFYEYACGGMEADPQINNKDLSDQAFDRIRNQLKKSKIRREYSAFMNYYYSCTEYYQETVQDKKILKAKEMLGKIGQFYTPADWSKVNVSIYPGITKLIANMILHNSPLLFDITPDVNEMDSQKFILRLGPLIDNENSLYNLDTNYCNTENDEFSSIEIDIEELYQHYENCKQNNERQSQESIAKALKIFGIFNHINYTFNKSAYIEQIVTDIDNRIIKPFSIYPRAREIHAEYKSKNYSIVTLGALQVQSKFINWTELIYTLTGRHLTPDTELQIYFKHQLIHYLESLEEFGELYELNNALLGLYARNLYEQFVKPKIIANSEEQCLHIAMNYLPSDASRLYLSSFTKKEMDFMNSTIHKVFIDLKETLKWKFERAQWATEAGRNELLKKIEKLQMSIPNDFKLKNISNKNMTYDFLDNTVILMKKLRADMYRVLDRTPSDPEQLWTYFAKPFQSHGDTIYSLNIILIPLGAVDMSNILQNNKNFDYLTLATIGNFIAREIAHHFDRNGISYWNGTRHSAFPHFNDEFTKAIYDDYINCHSHLLYQEPLNIILPASNKHIRIAIPETTLNNRLSDVMGVRLAHDTLARMESTSSKLLPWLDLDIYKLFYLAYAQTFCTKTPLTASYISLYERSIIPGRLRIFVAATNNKMLGELWKCREGSPIVTNFACDVFPYFEYQNVPVATM